MKLFQFANDHGLAIPQTLDVLRELVSRGLLRELPAPMGAASELASEHVAALAAYFADDRPHEAIEPLRDPLKPINDKAVLVRPQVCELPIDPGIRLHTFRVASQTLAARDVDATDETDAIRAVVHSCGLESARHAFTVQRIEV